MQRGKLLVPVQHLTEEPFRLDLRCSAADIGLEEFIGELSVDATIRRVNFRLQLVCSVSGQKEAQCDRCAEAFIADVSTTFEQWYVVNPEPGTIEEEAIALPPDWRYVVIDEDVREQLLIASPMKQLCREDCLGLCPTCGKNRNVDRCNCGGDSENPVWAGLKNVIK